MFALGYSLGICLVVLALAVNNCLNRKKQKEMTSEQRDALFRAYTAKSNIAGVFKRMYA
jgi:hypothetical protein